jgi:hypothetical protein
MKSCGPAMEDADKRGFPRRMLSSGLNLVGFAIFAAIAIVLRSSISPVNIRIFHLKKSWSEWGAGQTISVFYISWIVIATVQVES